MEKEIKVLSRDQEIIFKNWTNEDFEGIWDKKIYKLITQKSYYLPFYLAEHFGQKLIDRELIRLANEEIDNELERSKGFSFDDRKKMKEEVTRKWLVNHSLRQEMMDKCVEIIPVDENSINMVRPKEVIMKEVVLKRDIRGEKLEEELGTGLGVQINRKALQQAKQEEEFESEKSVGYVKTKVEQI